MGNAIVWLALLIIAVALGAGRVTSQALTRARILHKFGQSWGRAAWEVTAPAVIMAVAGCALLACLWTNHLP